MNARDIVSLMSASLAILIPFVGLTFGVSKHDPGNTATALTLAIVLALFAVALQAGKR